MWWDLDDNGISWFWLDDLTAWESSTISLEIVVLGELVNTEDGENTSIGNEVLFRVNLIAGKVSVSNELLSWLVDTECLWKLLSSQVD